jgi:hypothetical protein
MPEQISKGAYKRQVQALADGYEIPKAAARRIIDATLEGADLDVAIQRELSPREQA